MGERCASYLAPTETQRQSSYIGTYEDWVLKDVKRLVAFAKGQHGKDAFAFLKGIPVCFCAACRAAMQCDAGIWRRDGVPPVTLFFQGDAYGWVVQGVSTWVDNKPPPPPAPLCQNTAWKHHPVTLALRSRAPPPPPPPFFLSGPAFGSGWVPQGLGAAPKIRLCFSHVEGKEGLHDPHVYL